MNQTCHSYSIYSRDIGKQRLLHTEEELELARRYKEGDHKAGEALVLGNLRIAILLASKMRGYGLPHEDLVQEANLGLVAALKRFDPSRGYRFSTYAIWWVRARLTNFLMYNKSIVKFGTRAVERKMFFRVGSAVNRLLAKQADLTLDEAFHLVADHLSISAHETEEIYQRTKTNNLSLDLPTQLAHASSATLKDMLQDQAEPLDDQIDRRRLIDEVAVTLRQISKSPRELYLIEKRMLSEDPMTLSAIGDRFGISRQRVQQLEADLLDRLRVMLG